MCSAVDYKVRLKVRIGKGLTTDNTSLSARFNGREVTLKSAKQDQPLKDTSWLVLGVQGFTTECDAFEYGEDLRRAIHLAGLCTRVGVDGRAKGDNRETAGFTAYGDARLRSLGLLQEGQWTAPDVHGLSILPDDGRVVVAVGNASGHVTHDPVEFVRAIEEATTRGVTQEVSQAICVLNLAQINESPFATVVLAISSIESIAVKGEKWTSAQQDMLNGAKEWIFEEFGATSATREVAEAITRSYKNSLRQKARRLLTENDLLTLWPKWDNVYSRRSKLFHGGASREEGTVIKLAQDAMVVCGRMVLSIAKRQGAVLPSAAQLHFDIS